MSGCTNITVNVEYIGLPARLAGTGRERFDLGKQATLKELLAQVTARHPQIDKTGHLFIAVNKKKINGDMTERTLEDGDLVTIGVNVIGG